MNILLRIISGLFKIIYFFVYPIYWIKSRGSKKPLPPITDPLLKISATDLAEKIRNREIRSEHICNVYIKRIKEVNPILNAVVEERFENALQEARNVDLYLQSTDAKCDEIKKNKSLLGVPLTVKESCSLAGLSLSVGTLTRKGFRAEVDGKAVMALKASGAIPLLVSNTPELCISWETRNFLTGTTNNPYDVSCSSSGSSGGEGALLGAGASLIGIGSDLAGSIRMPALFNGVFGHKPTAKLISISGHFPQATDDYLVVGPMTRYAKDLKLMTKIMTNEEIVGLDQNIDLSKMKVFYMTDAGPSLVMWKVQHEIVVAIKRSVNHLRDNCGSKIVHDFKFTELENGSEIGAALLCSLPETPNLVKDAHQNLFLELCKSIVGCSTYTFNILYFYVLKFISNNFMSTDYYHKENQKLRQKFIEKLGDDGVFLYPTFPTSAIKHNSVNLKIMGLSYLMVFNTLGLPATHIPCGLDSKNMPIGIQVIAAPNQDKLCFAVAEELEKCFGGWVPPS